MACGDTPTDHLFPLFQQSGPVSLFLSSFSWARGVTG